MWICLGFSAIVFWVVNLVRYLAGKHNGWEILLLLSLSCALGALACELSMIHEWVLKEDWSALLDVVPVLSEFMSAAVIACIGLNGLLAAGFMKKRR